VVLLSHDGQEHRLNTLNAAKICCTTLQGGGTSHNQRRCSPSTKCRVESRENRTRLTETRIRLAENRLLSRYPNINVTLHTIKSHAFVTRSIQLLQTSLVGFCIPYLIVHDPAHLFTFQRLQGRLYQCSRRGVQSLSVTTLRVAARLVLLLYNTPLLQRYVNSKCTSILQRM
jgi:hypothetical protein